MKKLMIAIACLVGIGLGAWQMKANAAQNGGGGTSFPPPGMCMICAFTAGDPSSASCEYSTYAGHEFCDEWKIFWLSGCIMEHPCKGEDYPGGGGIVIQ